MLINQYNMNSQNIRTKVLSLVGIIMLVCIMALGFFAIPIGITICSLIGIIYSIKYKDKPFLKYSYIFLTIGMLSVAYTLLNIYSM